VIEALERAGAERRFLTAWALALVFAASACSIAGAAWRGMPHPHPMEELSYYPSGEHLRQVTLGHPESAADLAWLRAVQYYGEHRRSDMRFLRMTHVFDILTSLAPGFVPAYVFGAFALAQEGRDFRSAERLMLKGIEANPTSGELAFQLGFLYYVRPDGRSLEKASEYFEQAARQADAPPQAARFAAFARQHSGDLLVAYELWRQVYEHSPNPYLAERAEQEMERIRLAVAQGRTELAMRKLGTPKVLFLRQP
jgi:tetratricopeptide (TPR) repeat protein